MPIESVQFERHLLLKKINYLAGHAEINFTSLKYFELQTRDTLTDIN